MRRRIVVLVLACSGAIILGAVLLIDAGAPTSNGRGPNEQALAVEGGIGATVEPIDSRTAVAIGLDPRAKGLVITSVAGEGAASRAGIRTGDVIDGIGRSPVRSIADVIPAIGTGEEVIVSVNRRGRRANVLLKPGPIGAERPGQRIRG